MKSRSIAPSSSFAYIVSFFLFIEDSQFTGIAHSKKGTILVISSYDPHKESWACLQESESYHFTAMLIKKIKKQSSG